MNIARDCNVIFVRKFDTEFKMFLKHRGFNLDNSLFELRFTEPQNFASYRETELNSTRITAFTQINQTDYLSKRFMLKEISWSY
jgi:hypothetical protein